MRRLCSAQVAAGCSLWYTSNIESAWGVDLDMNQKNILERAFVTRCLVGSNHSGLTIQALGAAIDQVMHGFREHLAILTLFFFYVVSIPSTPTDAQPN